MSTDADTRVLIDAVRDLLADGWTAWPGGYGNDLELALIDAVFSIRAKYGRAGHADRKPSGVHAVVDTWRARRGDGPPDLRRLAALDPDAAMEQFGNRTVTAGRTKASAVVEAAQNLVAAGILTVNDLREHREAAKAAYVRVRGLGWVTFSYLCMLVGVPDMKADTWIQRFVAETLNRDVTSKDAYILLHQVADHLGKTDGHALPRTATELDHAIWAAMRSRS